MLKLLEEKLAQAKVAKEISDLTGETVSEILASMIVAEAVGVVSKPTEVITKALKETPLEAASNDDLASQLMENHRKVPKTRRAFNLDELLLLAPEDIVRRLREDKGYGTMASLRYATFGMNIFVPGDNLTLLLTQMGVFRSKTRPSESAFGLKIVRGNCSSSFRFHNGLADLVLWFLKFDEPPLTNQLPYGLVDIKEEDSDWRKAEIIADGFALIRTLKGISKAEDIANKRFPETKYHPDFSSKLYTARELASVVRYSGRRILALLEELDIIALVPTAVHTGVRTGKAYNQAVPSRNNPTALVRLSSKNLAATSSLAYGYNRTTNYYTVDTLNKVWNSVYPVVV